jgi:hypothetical protein
MVSRFIGTIPVKIGFKVNNKYIAAIIIPKTFLNKLKADSFV